MAERRRERETTKAVARHERRKRTPPKFAEKLRKKPDGVTIPPTLPILPARWRMQETFVIFGLGLGGALIGELLLAYIAAQGSDTSFSALRAAVTTVLAGAWTAVYFTLLDPAHPGIGAFVHYGLFIAILADEITQALSKTGTPRATPGTAVAAGAAAVGPSTPVLVLNGVWPVWGAGAFGGLVSELYQLYKTRGKKAGRHYSVLDWAVTIAMIPVAGAITALYGVSNVSGLLAMQLGASAPLIIGRLRR
jgi:hypothetical protein